MASDKLAHNMTLLCAFIVFSMIFIPFHIDKNYLNEESNKMEQLGGDGSIEEQCSAITFEDIFEYTEAEFHFNINDDWETADVSATAWINWTMADVVRERLDNYLGEIFPSGGDGWLSTDERDAVMGIAADCIEHTLTRIGIRDGPAHRGGIGVDWRNTTWESNSIDVSELNGIPSRHSEIRDCESWNPGNQCYEVPVLPSNDRDCDTDIDSSIGADECRFMLFLNSTMILSGVSNPDSFSIVINASNMSNAELEFNFPPVSGLRLDMWEECENRYLGEDISSSQNTESPLRGSCVGDGSSNFTLEENEDGSISYTIYPNSYRSNWPNGEDIFADFTTAPIPVDNPPIWTEKAPNNNSWLPHSSMPSTYDGEIMWANWNQISSWFDDESGVSNLNIICISSTSETIWQNSDRSFWTTVSPFLYEITCEGIDLSGQTSGNRTWNFGSPVALSTPEQLLQDPHPIFIQISDYWPPLMISIALVQAGPPSFTQFSMESSGFVNMSSIGMIPGPVKVVLLIEGENINQLISEYDLGIIKESTPPSISVIESYWVDSKWSARGQFSDPDGEDVSFFLFIGGSEMGEILVSGNSWRTPSLNFELWPEGEHDVIIKGCDSSSKCFEVSLVVNNTHLYVEEQEVIVTDTKQENSIPSVGMLTTVLSSAGALMYTRRRE